MVHRFSAIQAYLLAFLIAMLLGMVLAKWTKLSGSTVLAFTIFVFIVLLGYLDSPMRSFYMQMMMVIVVAVIAVIFGYETYRVMERLRNL